MSRRDCHKRMRFELAELEKEQKEIALPWKNATCLNYEFQLGDN